MINRAQLHLFTNAPTRALHLPGRYETIESSSSLWPLCLSFSVFLCLSLARSSVCPDMCCPLLHIRLPAPSPLVSFLSHPTDSVSIWVPSIMLLRAFPTSLAAVCLRDIARTFYAPLPLTPNHTYTHRHTHTHTHTYSRFSLLSLSLTHAHTHSRSIFFSLPWFYTAPLLLTPAFFTTLHAVCNADQCSRTLAPWSLSCCGCVLSVKPSKRQDKQSSSPHLT